MNDEIRGRLSQALPPDLPAPRIDLDEVERRGEGLLRRRRLSVVGLATAGVAVLAAAALLLPTAFAGGLGDGQAAETRKQKAYPLPELDPKEHYGWIGIDDEEQTEPTKALTEGYWDFLREQFPDLEVLDQDAYFESYGTEPGSGEPAGDVEFLDPADYPALLRGENTLGTVKDDAKEDWPDVQGSAVLDATDYTKPVYGLPTEEGMYGAVLVRMEDDDEFLNSFDISVHPKGSYAEGAKSAGDMPGFGPLLPYLAAGCDDGVNTTKGQPEKYDYECDEVDLPGGSEAQQIALTTTMHGEVVSRVNTVVVTLPNGNAVAINNIVDGYRLDGKSSEIGTYDDVEPAMSLDDLTALAQSLPKVIVE